MTWKVTRYAHSHRPNVSLFFPSNGKISRYYYKVVVYPCVGKLWGDSHQLWSRYVHLYLCIEHTHTHTGYISALCVWSRHAAARFTRISQRFGSESIYIFNLFLFLFFFFFSSLLLLFILFLSDRQHTHTRLAGWLYDSLYSRCYEVEYGTATARYRTIVSATRTHTHTHTPENKYGKNKKGGGESKKIII
jgi:hypothetical protein